MENKMQEVAQLVGLELEEEFRIDGLSYKYKLSNYGLMCWSNNLQRWYITSIIGELLTGEKQIIKLPKPILDDVEKEYLSAVIKPFRNRIISIRKYKYNQDEYIGIYVKYYAETDESEMITLPLFKKGTMYKGIELKKYYTLEELGL